MTEATTSPKQGLSDLNTSLGAPRHKDLYRVKEDPSAARAEQKGQARTLGLTFFLVFGVLISGLSFLLNHAHRAGRGAAVPALAQETLPGWAEPAAGAAADAPRIPNAAVAAWKQNPPRLASSREDVGQAPASLDFAFDPADDPQDAAAAAGKTPIRIYMRGHLVATAYYPEPPAKEAAAWVRLPDHEPAPARPSFVHAYREAKLLRLVPTRYVLYVGCVLGALGLLVPALLIPFYSFWMRYVAAPLGWFNTRVILGIVWVLIFTPLGLIRKLMGADALRRASLPKGESYWLERKKRDPKHFRNGF